MSNSFHDLIRTAAIAINDEDYSTWNTERITTWLNDAIRDYSQHFPRVPTTTINCADNDNDYDLPLDYMGILSVEYPDGNDPKDYLSRLPITHDDFWTGTSWYDIRPRSDDSDQSELIISPDPSTGENIEIVYHGHHQLASNPVLPTETVTIPPIHQHILIKYVMWQAGLQLMFAEQQSPTSNSSLLMAQLSQNARRLQTTYDTTMRQALFAADGESQPVQRIQTGDLNSRIY